MTSLLRRRWTGDDGASAVEYGILVAAVAAIIVVIVFTLGRSTSTLFQTSSDCITAGQAATC